MCEEKDLDENKNAEIPTAGLTDGRRRFHDWDIILYYGWYSVSHSLSMSSSFLKYYFLSQYGLPLSLSVRSFRRLVFWTKGRRTGSRNKVEVFACFSFFVRLVVYPFFPLNPFRASWRSRGPSSRDGTDPESVYTRTALDLFPTLSSARLFVRERIRACVCACVRRATLPLPPSLSFLPFLPSRRARSVYTPALGPGIPFHYGRKSLWMKRESPTETEMERGREMFPGDGSRSDSKQ